MNWVCKYLFLGVCVVFLVSCNEEKTKQGKLEDYIPNNVSMVFKISDFETLKTDLKNNSFISPFSKTTAFTFFSENKLLDAFQPRKESLLCINNTNFTLIVKQDTSLFKSAFLKENNIKKHLYKNFTVQEWIRDSTSIFSTTKDSVVLFSSSKNLINSILDGNTEANSSFKKLISNTNNKGFTAIFKTPSIKIKKEKSLEFASWASVKLEVLPNQIKATGVVLDHDSIPQILSIFKGLVPQINEIAKITPLNAKKVFSFTYNDFDVLEKNIARFWQGEISKNTNKDLFEGINEIGVLTFSENKAVVLKSFDPTHTKENLVRYLEQKSEFKETEIYNFNEPSLFTDLFSPLIDQLEPKYFFSINNFFVFTESSALAEHMITQYLNNNCLINSNFYKDTSSQLSGSSSLLLLQLDGSITSVIPSLFNKSVSSEIEKTNFKKYPLAALQLSYDRNFAHLNWVTKEVSKTTKISRSVSQILAISLDTLIITKPQFFTNHRTKGKDIVVQDVTNTLHFISTSGKTLWKKKLDGPILGEIQEVDLLKNGKKQIAFTTNHTFYIIDRNGKNVAPFPKKFKDKITQPLAVFNYDKKRNYRFLICQDKEVYMLDSKGKNVKGFTFKKTKSPITLAPQHIQIGSKDYILVAEKDGKLHILSRTGKSRISVSKKFEFSKIPIAKEATNFVVITKNNTKHSISQTGKVISKKLNVSNSYWFTVNGKTKATLDDNILRINGKLVELPFGIYTQPQIFNVNRKNYISITETQENKLYIYTKFGELLPNFPVYGTSLAQLNNALNNKKMLVLIGSGPKSFVIYEVQ